MKHIKFLTVFLLLLAGGLAQAQVRSNRLVIPDIEAPSGRTVQIPVILENTSDIIALQFDLTLPDGITAGQDDVSLTLRSENHTVTARNLNGKLRVMVFSPDNSKIRGNGGALIYINATIPGELEQGSQHQLSVSDAMVSDASLAEALTGVEAGKITITPSADLLPADITVSVATAAPGDEMTVGWNVRNIGSLPTSGGWRENVYVQSGDNKCLVGTLYNDESLAPGAHTARSITVKLPELVGVDGNADVVVKVIPNSDNAEPISAQGNNTAVLQKSLTLGKRLILVVPARHAENASRSVRCTLSRTGNTRSQQTYTLAVSGPGDPDRISVPGSVTLQYGDASAFFDIAVNNDKVVNNSGEYVITASGNGYEAVSAAFMLEDDEKPELDIEFSEEIDENGVTEGDSFTAAVISDYAPKADATINIFCERPNLFKYPASVVLPAGQTSVSFQITANQDDLIQGDSNTEFVVSAEGFIKGSEILKLKDDDIPSIELTLTPTTVNENAGYYAMEASLRRTSNLNTRATIKFSDDSKGVLLYDKQIVMGKGVEEAQFSIGVLDDANVNGERNYTVKAAVWLSSCSCTAGTQSGGEVQVGVTVLDDDGHALRLAVDRGTWLEGGSGTLTLSHNSIGGLPDDLTVSLSSDYDSMLEYSHQVTIPAGQTSVQVPVQVKRNDIEGDGHNVTFSAQAAGFTKGVIWVQVSDQTIPDAIITEVFVSDPDIYAGGRYDLTARVQNTGYAPLADGAKVSFYDAGLRKEIGTAYLAEPLAAGASADVVLTDAVVCGYVGNARIYAEINGDRKINELSFSNNRSKDVTFNVVSPIYVTVDALNATYGLNEEITITGSVRSAVEGADVSKVDVDVYVINDSYRKVLKVKSGADGSFSTVYTPAPGQLGRFAVGACYPGTDTRQEMTGFDIVGLRTVSDAYIKVELSTNEPLRLLIPVENPSSVAIHNLRMRQLSFPEGVTVSVVPVAEVPAGETIHLDVTITSDRPSLQTQWYPAVFAVDSDEGSPLSLTIYEITRNTFGVLKAEEPVIRTTMNVHTSRTYPVTVTNTGRGETGKMTLSLPDFLKAETPVSMPSIGPDESATIILRLAPNENTVANVPMNGQIAVNCENGHGVVIPFNITPVSSLTGSLRVNVCDEYTYYSDGGPMVKDATVQVRNAYTNSIIAELNTGEDGYVLFRDIPEGYYTVTVTADQHDSYRGNFIVDPGETKEVEAFITFQAITIEWEVEETEVEDEYSVVSTVRFETGVPKPVIIITVPKKFSLGEFYDNSKNLFYMSVTNEGLITANDIKLKLPPGTYHETDEHGNVMRAHFEWQECPEPFSLAPKQTVQIPFYLVKGDFPDRDEDGYVVVADPSQRNSIHREPRRSGGGGGCICPFMAAAAYKCASMDKQIEAFTSSNIGTCGDGPSGGGGVGPSSSSGGGGPGVPPSYIFGSGSGKGGSSNVDEGSGGCDTCAADKANALTSCVVGFTPIGCAFGVISAAADIVEGAFDPYDWRSWANLALTAAGCVINSTPIGIALSAASCALSLTAPCPGNGSGNAHAPAYLVQDENGESVSVSEDDYIVAAQDMYSELIAERAAIEQSEAREAQTYANGPMRAGASVDPTQFYKAFLQSAAGVMYTLWNNLDFIYKEQFGSTEGGWADMTHKEMTDLYRVLMGAPEDQPFHPSDWMSVKPAKLSTEEFTLFLERINNTMLRRQGLPYDESNFINEQHIQNSQRAMRDAMENMYKLGYSDADELCRAVLKQHGILTERNKTSVCASVVLKFEQSLVMTRQAFRGTLTVTNGHSSKPMTDVKLSLKISDQYGRVASSHEFQINPEKLSGFEGQLSLDAGWSLAADAKGVANILFIPTRYAAPAEDVVYYFGGSLSYMDPFNDVEVTRQLQPVAMTVRPSAVLTMDYFLDRVLYGDDPMTKDVIEPVVPGEFSLLINNVGLGDATNVNMTTKQPKIVENEKGLYIDFEIIGATMNGKESAAAFGESIVTPFGTIPAQKTAYAQWWLTSSLLGQFTEYEVEATHVTSYDNPYLSLLESVNIHPLIRSLVVDESGDRPEMGFLVDDYKDTEFTPDHIYLTTGEVEGVGPVDVATIEPIKASKDSETVLNYKLTVIPEFYDWTYGFVTDPTGGKQTVERVVRVSDNREMPVRNFWQTDRTLVEGEDPIVEYKLHFADCFKQTREEYIITFSPKPEVELEVAEFSNVPDEGNYPDSQVKYIDVTFNKPIDPETFTLDDISFTVEGVKQDMSRVTLAPATEGSTTTFRLTFDDSYGEQSGFYSITVQTAGITDCEGFHGASGKECHWTFLKENFYTLTFTPPEGYTFNVVAYEPSKDSSGHVRYYLYGIDDKPLLDSDGRQIRENWSMIYSDDPVEVKTCFRPFELAYPLHLVFSLSPLPGHENDHLHEKPVFWRHIHYSNGMTQTSLFYSEYSELRGHYRDYPWNYYSLQSMNQDTEITVTWEPVLDNRLIIDVDKSNIPYEMHWVEYEQPYLISPKNGMYQVGSTVELKAGVPNDAFNVKWYQVKKAKMKDGDYYPGYDNPCEPLELELLSTEPTLRYKIDKMSFNDFTTGISDAMSKRHHDPDGLLLKEALDNECSWIVLKMFCRTDQDIRIFQRYWNRVSFNDEGIDLNSFMATCGGAIEGIICGDRSYIFKDGEWQGEPIELEVGKSYDINFNRTVMYRRLNAVRSIIEETPIELDEGWSCIGYTPLESLPVNEALKEYDGAQENDVLKDYDSFAVYTEDRGWVGSLETMSPGVGYQYYTTDTNRKSFYYTADTKNAVETPQTPETQGNMPRRITFGDSGSLENPQPLRGAYPDNMTMIAKVINENNGNYVFKESDNYRLMAFIDDECRGVGKFVDGNLIFLNIYGTDDTVLPGPAAVSMHKAPVSAPAMEIAPMIKEKGSSQEVMFALNNSDQPNELWTLDRNVDFTLEPQGSIKSPVTLKLGNSFWTGTGDVKKDLKMYSARPNPVRDRLYLIGLTEEIKSWTLVSINGATMNRGESFDNAKGLDMSSYSSGHYILLLDTSFGPQSVKIIKE